MNLHARWSSLFVIVIQLSYTAGISIFWLADLCHVILGCYETTSLTSLSWCKFNTSLSLHHAFGWLKLWQVFFFFFFFAVHLIWIIKYVNALIFRELSGFTCIRLLARNSKFSIPHSAAAPCGVEISSSISSLLACVAAVSFPFPDAGNQTSERKSGRAKKHAWGEQKIGEKWFHIYFLHSLPSSYVSFA